MRCRNTHSAQIEGVAPGTEGEIIAPAHVLAELMAAGLIASLEPVALEPASSSDDAASKPTTKRAAREG